MSKAKHKCLISCSGLHADVERKDESLMNLYKENRKSTSESFEKVSDVLSTGKEKLLHERHYHIFIQWSANLARTSILIKGYKYRRSLAPSKVSHQNQNSKMSKKTWWCLWKRTTPTRPTTERIYVLIHMLRIPVSIELVLFMPGHPLYGTIVHDIWAF